jgi:hypothetical protein
MWWPVSAIHQIRETATTMDPTTSHTRHTARWTAVALLGALSLVAAACGDDDDGGDGASGGGDDFCAAMAALDEEFADEEPTQEDIEGILSSISDVDPPAEIEESWNTMVDFMGEFVDDPTAASEDQLSEFEAASDDIDAFMEEECDIGS